MTADVPFTESHSYPSYAQSGEDRIVYSLLESLGLESGVRYADVGAAAPAGHNNTYLFYTLGGQGVLVEADPKYLPAYAAIRPRDAVESCAVVPKRLGSQQTVTFYAMNNQGWSSIRPENVTTAERTGHGTLRDKFAVPCRTLDEILGQHFPAGGLDLLSLDVEGVDIEILSEFDISRFRPKIIVYEEPSEDIRRVGPGPHEQRLEAAGYRLYAFTHANRIFVDRNAFQGARF